MTRPDFDTLCAAAHPNGGQGPRAATDALWTAAFSLPEWHFAVAIHRAEVPYTAVHEGQRFLFAFTDGVRLARFIDACPDPGLSYDFWMTMPVGRAREYLADRANEGVFGVQFNFGQPGWSAPLSAIEGIAASLKLAPAPPSSGASLRAASPRAESDAPEVQPRAERWESERDPPPSSTLPITSWVSEPRARFVKGHLADFPRRPFEPTRRMSPDEHQRWEMTFLDRYPCQYLDQDEKLVALVPGSMYRTEEGAILSVAVSNHGHVTGHSIVEGDEARELEAHHAFQFENDLWNKLTRLLVVGANANDAMAQAFGPNAKKVPLIVATKRPDGSTERVHRAVNSGLVVVCIEPNGVIRSTELLSGGAAFRRLIDAHP